MSSSVVVGVLTAAAAGLLSGYFLCELGGKLFDAGFLANRLIDGELFLVR